MPDHLTRHFDEPDRCPYCGSTDIDGRSVNIEEQTTTQRVQCTSCNRHWDDLYRLAAVVDDQNQYHPRPAQRFEAQPVANMTERDVRQRDLVPPEELARCSASVIGVGAVGRQVALQLGAIGVPQLRLFDPQIVERENLAAQGYLEDDLGSPKAEATARLCARVNSSVTIDPRIQRFRRSDEVGDCVFVCVDSIETRRLIWAAVRDRVRFFCDGRMSGEVVRVLTAADEPGRGHYPATLFAGEEAHVGACTARSTIYTANVAGGLMLTQFTRWLRRLPVDADLTLNLLASELSVAPLAGDR